MCSLQKKYPPLVTIKVSDKEVPPDFISFIRARLNVIGTSLYLLQDSMPEDQEQQRYLDKIKQQLDAIIQQINQY